MERYYRDLHSRSDEFFHESYDSNKVWVKDMLNVLLCYLQTGYLSSAHAYLGFLSELKLYATEWDVLEAIDCVVEEIKGSV